MSEEYPEMTKEEQKQRRQEHEAYVRRQTDRSSGYWCERDSNGVAFLMTPSGKWYLPPESDPKFQSVGHVKGESPNYSQCPVCGTIRQTLDTKWWKRHYETHADEAEKAMKEKEVELKERDPLVATLIRYANETQYGEAHVKRWNQALTAIGYKTDERAMTLAEARDNFNRYNKSRWGPVVRKIEEVNNDRNSDDSNGDPVSDPPSGVDPAPIDLSQRPGSPEWRKALLLSRINKTILPKWSHAQAKAYYLRKGFHSYNAPTPTEVGPVWIDFELCDDGTYRQVDMPVAFFIEIEESDYIYGQDLQEAMDNAEKRGDLTDYIAISAEIDLRLTSKGNVPSFVTKDVVDEIEGRYPKIRLDNVRLVLFNR